jgi:hypothetical protein
MDEGLKATENAAHYSTFTSPFFSVICLLSLQNRSLFTESILESKSKQQLSYSQPFLSVLTPKKQGPRNS